MGVTIGYLTDMHLRKHVPGTSPIDTRHCRKMAELIPVALDRMSCRSLDVIVCTGDLLDVAGEPGAVEDLELCKRLFDECELPYLVLPGNHDPAPDGFYRVFPMPPKRTVLNNCELISFHEDTCAAGERASERSAASLQRMTELLIADNDCPEATVLLQHYVVYPDHNEGYPHNYLNDEAIKSILERSNRQLLCVSGHYHPGIPVTQNNGVAYFAGRAFCEPPYTCYVISVSASGVSVEEIVIAELG